MKRNVSLYIAGTKVDLDDNSLILFNYAMTDLTNPTIVKNSYSHQVKLKGTKTNNKLFGEIFRLDRQTIYSDGYTGVNFDPMRKTPFEIYDETSTCLESGYVKLNSISRNGADISYNVTLYGGLGSFLYGLSYNEDGSKKTLADLWYTNMDGEEFLFKDYKLRNIEIFGAKDGNNLVKEAWDYKKQYANVWNIIQFAPCYNGLPKEFDSDKMIIPKDAFVNCVSSRTDEKGNVYTSGDVALYRFKNKHTEWEIGDLRWYLQRPVINVKEILRAIQNVKNNGGYTVNIEGINGFRLGRTYMTLPLIAPEDRSNPYLLYKTLNTTCSPADFLISLAKTMGMYILCDMQTKIVDVVSRETFFEKYKEDVFDLTPRVNMQSLSITPLVADSKYYQMGGDVAGEFAEDYKEEYRFDYASQRINTGYNFNVQTKSLTEGIVFKGAAQVVERSRLFKYVVDKSDKTKRIFPLPQFEKVSVVLYNNSLNDRKEFDMYGYLGDDVYYSDSQDNDAFPKPQFHSAENETIDGSHVLLFSTGKVDVSLLGYKLTNDLTYFDSFNEGRPCWCYIGQDISDLPVYRRFNENGYPNFNYDWAVPQAYGMPVAVSQEGETLYDQFWKGYIQDLYNGNTKILKCKVNLRGMENGQELLRRFYWFQGSLWVMSKISNLSLTTFDDAECELIKVNDIENYTNQAGW